MFNSGTRRTKNGVNSISFLVLNDTEEWFVLRVIYQWSFNRGWVLDFATITKVDSSLLKELTVCTSDYETDKLKQFGVKVFLVRVWMTDNPEIVQIVNRKKNVLRVAINFVNKHS
jgi:hypothetical protein